MLDKKNEDYWQWDGKETLIRIHKTPRRQNFVPQDCEDCPCDPRIICDERETEQKFKTNTRVIKDTWRFKGDNHESTNKLNEFWTGKSTFKVLANAEVIDGDKNCKVSQGVITLCTHCDELNTIPITDVFVPYQYHIEVGKHEVDHPKVSVILWREKKNRTLEFEFSKSPCDLMTSKFAKFSLAINLIEVPRAVPCFVLLCSEERNWFTFLQNKMKDEMKFHVVPITEDDDMLSPYGISKARRCLRTKLDSVFFAGPCTGGSPWNRINRWVSEATTQLIEAKKQIFWAMWEVFASVLSELINMGSPALLELPRGCDYWKDRRMTDLVEGTVSHEHKFDGCMYGLKSQFQETPKPIKKPWKIVTWGVSFPKLHRRCDRRHDHVECAGRETRITQVYTKWIAKIIMNGINDHVIRNSPFVNVKVMKRWKSLAFDEQLKAEMSRDSENVRSHPIKSVATSVCATRELDVIDHSFEQSLLHWCLSRLISTSVLSSWHIIFVSAALWIRLRLVVTRPTVRTTIFVDRVVVTRPTVRATYFCTKRDGRNQWHELIRTVLKQPNHHCPESVERIIRRNDRSQGSTVPGYSRRKPSPTLKWGHRQPMDQIWHATCSRLLSLFREHQVHQRSNCGSPGSRLQAAAEVTGCNDGTLHGQGDLRQTWWTLDCFVQRTFSWTLWWPNFSCRIWGKD